MTGAIPTSLLIHTVTWIVPTTATDSYGNTTRTYGSGTSIAGRMQQDKTDEPLPDGRDPLIREWTLFTNQDGISGYDRIVFGALTFEVNGAPRPTYGGTGFHHAEVPLRKVDG